MATETGINTIVLQPGETVMIPSGVNVTGIIGTSFTTTCTGLPTPENYSCYHFYMALSTSEDDDTVFEDNGTPAPTIATIEIGGTTYTINSAYNINASDLHFLLEAALPQSIFKVFSVSRENFNDRSEFVVKFKTVPSIVDTIDITLQGVGFPGGIHVYPSESDDCDCLTGHDQDTCDDEEEG